jgi:uncharacterized protein
MFLSFVKSKIEPIWNVIKRKVEDSNLNQLVYSLTGSVTPPPIEGLHTGTGRIVSLGMKPMSLYESGESDGTVSLPSLLDRHTKGSAISN